jgi:hypothetical protein
VAVEYFQKNPHVNFGCVPVLAFEESRMSRKNDDRSRTVAQHQQAAADGAKTK